MVSWIFLHKNFVQLKTKNKKTKKKQKNKTKQNNKKKKTKQNKTKQNKKNYWKIFIHGCLMYRTSDDYEMSMKKALTYLQKEFWKYIKDI